MALYLGVDFGTSTAKATVLNDQLRIVCRITENLRIINPKPGFYEVDPENTWWKTFIKLLSRIANVCRLEDIAALSISSVCGSFVPMDSHHRPAYNAILYGIDTRAAKVADRLNNLFGSEYLIRTLGSQFTTHSVLPKLIWLKEQKPDVYCNTAYFLESTNYITFRLTGVRAWDLPTASGCQLVDLSRLTYPTEIIEAVGLDIEKLPPLKWPMHILGTVSEDAAQLTGLKEGTKVAVGACDIYAEAVACGAMRPGDLLLVLGSTTSIFLHTSSLMFVDGFSSGVSVLPGLYKLGGATSSGSRFLDTMKRLIRPLENDALINMHCNLPTGLIILPYLNGARCPYHNPSAVGAIYGLRTETTLEDLHVSLLEALALEIAVIITKLAGVISYNTPIHVTGGLSNIDLMHRLLANVLDDIVVIHHNIDASVGDALIAVSSLFRPDKPFTIEHSTTTIHPEKNIALKYRSLVKKYDLIYKCLAQNE